MKRLTLFITLLALLTVACETANTLPTAPAAIKAAPPVVPTAQTENVICLSAEAVRLRMGAGTSYGEMVILTAGDVVTVTGVPVVSEDMGVWMPVRFGAVSGWVNARYLC